MRISELVFIIIIAAVITERLLEGLHRFYWTRKLKIYLVGDGDGEGILPDGPLREFIRCKFCQSFWVSWGASLLMLSIIGVTPPKAWGELIINTILIGLVVGSLANKLHDLCHSIKAMRYRGLS